MGRSLVAVQDVRQMHVNRLIMDSTMEPQGELSINNCGTKEESPLTRVTGPEKRDSKDTDDTEQFLEYCGNSFVLSRSSRKENTI